MYVLPLTLYTVFRQIEGKLGENGFEVALEQVQLNMAIQEGGGDTMKKAKEFLSPEQIQALEDEEYCGMTREQIINTFRSVEVIGEPVDTEKLERILKKFGK